MAKSVVVRNRGNLETREEVEPTTPVVPDDSSTDDVTVEEQEVPEQPSFVISEGLVQDIEMHGEAVDPFTGVKVTADDVKELLERRKAKRPV